MRKPVFVVDDDRDIREALRDTLASESYETIEANDGKTALDYLRTHPPPGVILLDWNMAPMNGAQFMAEFTNDPSLASIPVFLVTADGRVADGAKSKFAGLLTKPVDVDALFKIAERYCN